MTYIPLETLIENIKESSGLSEEEIQSRINKKLDELAGLISKEGAAHILANELGVKLQEASTQLSIAKILAGMKNVELTAKVRQVYELREFKNDRRSGKVANMLVSDPSGTCRVVLWNEQADKLKETKAEDVIRIKGGYARENNGRVEVHVSESGSVEVNPQGVSVDVEISQQTTTTNKKIAELTESDTSVSVTATIVQVFEPRFFPTCPECRTRVKEENNTFVCPTHGQVQAQYNYVMNLTIDDGSDNIRCVLWREQAAKLLERSDEEMITFKDEPLSFENYKRDLLGVIVELKGRVNKNEAMQRIEFVAYEVKKDVNLSVTRPSSKTVTQQREEVRVSTEDGKVKTFESEKETTQQTSSEDIFTLEDLEDLDE